MQKQRIYCHHIFTKKNLHDRFHEKDLIKLELQGKRISIKNSNMLISKKYLIYGVKKQI